MSPKDWESAVDQQIREAQEQGKFDNLPGKGQPLDLTPNPFAQVQGKELAFKILKDAGHAPEWIEMDKAIRGKRDRARETLKRHRDWHQARMKELEGRSDRWAAEERKRSVAGWQGAIITFVQEVEKLNKDIADLNLKVPSTQFQRGKVKAAREIELVQGAPE